MRHKQRTGPDHAPLPIRELIGTIAFMALIAVAVVLLMLTGCSLPPVSQGRTDASEVHPRHLPYWPDDRDGRFYRREGADEPSRRR